MYEPRNYRRWVRSNDLVSVNVTVKETDLNISGDRNLSGKARVLVAKYRSKLEKYISNNPDFLNSLLPVSITEDAPDIVRIMAQAAEKANVGPMAAVAGAIAGCVGEELGRYSKNVIIENGGDIYLKSTSKRVIALYTGETSMSGKLGLEIDASETPLGVSTSSGKIGHSLSYGKADAVTVVSPSSTLADACATAIANRVSCVEDIQPAIDFGKTIDGISGILIVVDEKIGVWGNIKLAAITVSEQE